MLRVSKIIKYKKKQENFEFYMGQFLDEYEYHNGRIETLQLVKDMLLRKHIDYLPKELKEYGRMGVSLHLARAIEKKMHSDEYKIYNIGRFIPYIRDAYFYAETVKKQNSYSKKR